MSEQESTTVEINGQQYDARTGLPVSNLHESKSHHVHSAPVQHAKSSHSIHAKQQRSHTLRRDFVHKPVGSQRAVVNHTAKANHSLAVDRHPDVRKFAPHPSGINQPSKVISDIGPSVHPAVAKAHARSAEKHAPAHHDAHAIKEQALKTAVANTHAEKPRNKFRFRKLFARRQVVSVMSAVIALVIFGGYLTYLNIPNLSVRVAAMQAGIDAGYPSYHPDGYALRGPVTYSSGKVSMNFSANAGPQAYTISQSGSNWDNEAVLDNFVTPRAGNSYIPYSERGLMIYTYGNNAVWVNGGILYTLEGDAPLSSEQIRRIATSLL